MMTLLCCNSGFKNKQLSFAGPFSDLVPSDAHPTQNRKHIIHGVLEMI